MGVVVVDVAAAVAVWANGRDFVEMGIRFYERRRRESIPTDVDDYVSVVKRR